MFLESRQNKVSISRLEATNDHFDMTTFIWVPGGGCPSDPFKMNPLKEASRTLYSCLVTESPFLGSRH